MQNLQLLHLLNTLPEINKCLPGPGLRANGRAAERETSSATASQHRTRREGTRRLRSGQTGMSATELEVVSKSWKIISIQTLNLQRSKVFYFKNHTSNQNKYVSTRQRSKFCRMSTRRRGRSLLVWRWRSASTRGTRRERRPPRRRPTRTPW